VSPVGQSFSFFAPASDLVPRSLVGAQSLVRARRVGMQGEVRIPSGADIRESLRAGARFLAIHIPEAAHIREAVHSKVPHPANICDHMDRDGNPADIPRTGSAQARREAKRSNCKCARTWKTPRPDEATQTPPLML
jgi:hypothetical protein